MSGLVGRLGGAMLRGAIRGYQLTFASFFVGACRFEPSCSFYASEAIARHGPGRGSWLAICRLCRCHPWAGSGYDPVPPRSDGLICSAIDQRHTPIHE